MAPKIIESYTTCGVDVGRIVKRILRFLDPERLEDLKAINLLDSHHPPLLGQYRKKDAEIDIYVQEILGWQPWLLRKTFVFPYLTIGLTLGHEIDHYANRDNNIDQEYSAEMNAFRYVYPSLGIFKPVYRAIGCILRLVMKHRRIRDLDGKGI